MSLFLGGLSLDTLCHLLGPFLVNFEIGQFLTPAPYLFSLRWADD